MARLKWVPNSPEETTFEHLDPKTTKDRAGRITNYIYNAVRQLAVTVDPENQTTLYEWCKCGDLKSITDALGRVTTWRHDVAGRVTAKEFPLANGTVAKTTYAYIWH